MQRTVQTDKKEANNILKKHKYLIRQCYIIDFIVHVSSHFLVQTSWFTFYLIFFSLYFIDHVSFLFPSAHNPSYSFHLPQSISFIFTLFDFTHATWSFNLIASFTFQPIQSLEINNLRLPLDKFLILYRYSLPEPELWWFYYYLPLYIKQEIQQAVQFDVGMGPDPSINAQICNDKMTFSRSLVLK